MTLPMQRFRVHEDSMRPTLAPGDELVVTGSRTPVVGDVVTLPHPHRPGFWLVKRLTAGPGNRVDGKALGAGEAWVTSDNPRVGTADSNRFGVVPLASLRPMVTRFDETTFLEAVAMLCNEEPPFAEVVEEHGPPPFWQRPAGFPTLVWLIMEQKVSLESGAAMYRRLHGLLGTITPEAVAGSSEADLRAIGVTRQKTAYLLRLARSIVIGELDLDALGGETVEDARRTLLAINGIGPWTADAYLLSALRFPDVFPVGDRALQVGTAEVLSLASAPPPDDLDLISSPWRPVRAAAARIIWHSYLKRRGRVEPSDPTADSGHTPLSPA